MPPGAANGVTPLVIKYSVIAVGTTLGAVTEIKAIFLGILNILEKPVINLNVIDQSRSFKILRLAPSSMISVIVFKSNICHQWPNFRYIVH